MRGKAIPQGSHLHVEDDNPLQMFMKQSKALSEHLPLKEKVYEILKEQITNLSIPPGVRIYEDDLATGLQVSRTPVNWAIARLIQEGLIKRVPRRGLYVTEITRDQIKEVLIVREALEGMAARLAAENIDDWTVEKMRDLFRRFSPKNLVASRSAFRKADIAFHNMVITSSGCKEIARVMAQISEKVNIYRLMTSGLEGRTRISLQEHLEIIDTLERRDPERAEALMRQHIRKVREKTIIQDAIPEDSVRG